MRLFNRFRRFPRLTLTWVSSGTDEPLDQNADFRRDHLWAAVGPERGDAWSWMVLRTEEDGQNTELASGYAPNEYEAKRAAERWPR